MIVEFKQPVRPKSLWGKSGAGVRALDRRPWSTNEGYKIHRMQRAELVKSWRTVAAEAFKDVGPLAPKVLITLDLAFYTAGRRDGKNYLCTPGKAIVDGMVDAGCLEDDTNEYIAGLWCRVRKDPDNMVCRVEILEGM